ncbi:DNA polymerase III subunit psi [Psychrobacter sp. DM8]|uniref:DNA polymerase III subunit psi n=1 Tax=unclassified Psychrobacter TaxID=196806 RepID=UPI003F4F4E21
MSDIQDTQHQTPTPIPQSSVTQRLMQQRQILAMMGIGQWVQPDSLTLNIDDIGIAEEQILVSAPVVIDSASDTSLESSRHSQAPAQDTPVAEISENQSVAGDDIKPNSIAEADYHFDSIDPVESSVAPAIAPLLDQVTTLTPHSYSDDKEDFATQDKVAPFDLQGARYSNWVLIVDIQALDSNGQKLWQNIVQALSLNCETTSFPICAGMDTAELANASLAGYIFRIGRSEEIQVAALTELPEGLTHPKLAQVPTLSVMLTDSMLKRELWQQISS